MDRKTITRHMREQFFPLLVEEGFTRQRDTLRRILDGPVAHVVTVRHFPARKEFRVDLGAHLPALDEPLVMPATNLETITVDSCLWGERIVTGFLHPADTGMAYGTNEEEASEAVAFIASEWKHQSRAFFGPLSNYPEGFLRLARQALVGPHQPGWMVTAAHMARVVGDHDLSLRIAAAALPLIPDERSSLRDEAQMILTTQSDRP